MTLLRALIRLRRDQGWTTCVYGRRPLKTHTWSRYRAGFYEVLSWDGQQLSGRGEPWVIPPSPLHTVGAIVTVLYAHGLVPQELTPAYEAGWRAGVHDTVFGEIAEETAHA